MNSPLQEPPLQLPTYSIVIPAYNESARITATLQRILAYAAEQGWNSEVVVVDDGSRDTTAEIVRSFADKNVRLLQNPENRGKGYSVRNGMMHANGELLLFTDADLAAPIEEANKLFAALAQGADVAIGSRWLQAELQSKRQPLYRQFFGRLFNVVLRLVLGLDLKDTQCGFKAFTRRAAQALFPMQRIEGWTFDPELLYLAKKLGFKVAEVAVVWAHQAGTRIRPLRDGSRIFAELLVIRWNALCGKYPRTAGPKNI